MSEMFMTKLSHRWAGSQKLIASIRPRFLCAFLYRTMCTESNLVPEIWICRYHFASFKIFKIELFLLEFLHFAELLSASTAQILTQRQVLLSKKTKQSRTTFVCQIEL